tara:strand:+ start:243 stop:2582 length:2340 start_codon:yes stop_codon:yes gene_type:complete
MSSSAAFAQDEAANSAAQTSTGIGEIVVTAQRREQSLQDTPIAVTAFTSETLEQARVQSFGDLITKIPGFSINSFTKSRQSVALRGGSSSLSSPGSDNAVALFIDDIYFGASGDFETANLFDLERIEVLRGPQGTLFGRNSTGGAIMIVTKDPVPGPTGAVELSVGNYDLVQAKGFVSGSLNDSDTILGSLAFAATNQDGTSYNRATDERIDDVNRVSIRGKIKWLMAEDVSLLVTGSYGKVNETNEARDFLGATPTADSLEAIGFVPDRNPRVVDQFSSGRFNSRNWLVSAKLEARFDSGIFTSITGYRDNNSDQTPSDYVGTPVRMFSIAEPRHLKQFSQEFRWVSATSGPLDWTAGLYFLHQSDRRSSFTETFYDPSTFAGARQAGVLCPGIQGDERNFALPACVAAFPERFDPDNPNEVERFQRSSVYSYAAYLEGSYELTDQLTLTLGGRITHDRKTASGGARGDLDWVLNPLANASPGGFEGTAAGWRVSGLEKSWTAFTPRAIVDWKPSEEILVYGTISRGVRSGAYSFGSIEATSVVPVEPEFVWNYEIGMKRQFFDNRARLNLAAFQANYKGAQFFYFDNTAGSYIFDNAGKSRVRGIEVEATLIPVRGLTLSSNYTYQTGKISGFPPESGLENGITPAQTPKHTLNLGASYEVALASGGTLGIFGDFQYKSKYQLETDPSPAFTSRVKGLVNGSIAYTTPNERWVLSVWGKNLTNENIKVYGNDFKFLLYTFDEAYNSSSPNFNPDADTANMPRYAPPRTFGASLKYSF